MSKYNVVITPTRLKVLAAAYLTNKEEKFTNNNIELIKDFIDFIELTEKQRLWGQKEKNKKYQEKYYKKRKNRD